MEHVASLRKAHIHVVFLLFHAVRPHPRVLMRKLSQSSGTAGICWRKCGECKHNTGCVSVRPPTV